MHIFQLGVIYANNITVGDWSYYQYIYLPRSLLTAIRCNLFMLNDNQRVNNISRQSNPFIGELLSQKTAILFWRWKKSRC